MFSVCIDRVGYQNKQIKKGGKSIILLSEEWIERRS